MNSLKINSVPSFHGSREIVAREILANGKKRSISLQDMLSQSQLRTATDALMKDLNFEEVGNWVKKNAVGAYETTSEKLNL